MALAAQKEAVVVVLDVGQAVARMADPSAFTEARLAVVKVIQNKILFSARDEVGVLLIGTKGTRNSLAEQFPGEYMHITVHRGLEPPSAGLLRSLSAVSPDGGGPADFL
eukprot:RCo012333